MADENLGTGTVTIEISDVAADRSLDALASKIEQKLDRAARVAGRRIELALARSIRRISPAKIEIEADLTRFNQMIRTQTDLTDVSVDVPAIPKVNKTEWKRLIQAAVADIEIKIKVVPDVSGFDRAVRQITAPTIRANVETRVDNDSLVRAAAAIDRAIAGSVKAAAGFAALALRIGSVGIAAAGAAQAVIGLGAALAPAVGIFAAAPAAIFGFVAASGALKLALAGVSDAFKAALTGDAKAFQKAIESLSPAAQAAAKEVRALKPAFDNLKNSVQDAFFKQFEGQITATAKALGGPLKDGLTGISAAFGKATATVAKFLQSNQAISDIRGILGSTQTALGGLGTAAQSVLQGFLDIANSVGAAFGARLSGGIQGAAANIGSFLSKAADSGKAIAWVDGALKVFAQLGQVIGNVGGILSGVFKAAQATSGGLLGNLQTVTQSFETFVKSAEGQTALQNVFKGISAVAAQLGPIIGALVTQLGNIAPALVPLFTTIGPAIQGLIPGVQALVSGLASGLASIASSGVLTSIGQAIGQIGVAIAPILPLAGQLIGTLGAALAPVLSALAPVLGAVVSAVGGLVTALSPLLLVAGDLIAKLGPILTPIVTALNQVFLALAPVVQTAANILSSVLGPILDVLPGLIQPFLDQITNLINTLLPPFNDLLIKLEPSLNQVTQALVQVAQALIPVITQIVALSAKVLNALMPLLAPLISLIADLAAIFAGRLANVLTTVVVPALSAVASFLKGDFSGAFSTMKDVVKAAIKVVIDEFTQLPLDILRATVSFGNLLFTAGSDLIKGMINGVRNVAGSLVSAVKDVVGSAIDGAKSLLHINSPSKVFFVIGVQTGQGLINGIDSMASRVGTAASDMAAAAVAPFTDLSVNGPTVNGFNSGSALAAITQPFGSQGSSGITTTTATRQTSAQGAATGNSGATIQNTFNITEAGNATATAERVVNRLVTAAGVFL